MLRLIAQQLNRQAFSIQKFQSFVQLNYSSRYKISEENKLRYYKLHEVQFVNFNDQRDTCDLLVESQYFQDSQQERQKFLEDKMGINRCVEFKHKLNYVMNLRDKEMYQQKKVTELINIAIKYMEKRKNNFDNMDDKKQQEFVYFLRNINELILYMNIVDANIWRTYFECVAVVAKTKGYNFHFMKLMNSMDQFCKRFYNNSCDLFRYKIVFKDEDFANIISPKLIQQLLNNLEKCPINDQNPKSYILTLFFLASVLWKVSKNTNVLLSGYHRVQFFVKQQQNTLKILSTLEDIDLAMSLYYSIGISGAVNKDIQTAFSDYFISQMDQIKRKNYNLYKIIDLWVNIGNGSQQLYDMIEPIRMSQLLQSKDIAQIIKQLCLVPSTNIQVRPEIIKNLFDLIIQICDQSSIISYFQIEVLYNVLVYYNNTMPEVINKQFYETSIYNQIIDHMRTNYKLEIGIGQPKQSLLDLKKEVDQLKQRTKNQQEGLRFNKDNDVNDVKNTTQGLKQEHICTKSLVYWLNIQNLEDEFIITTNQRVGFYEIDILVYAKKLDKLIGIEIQGQNYKSIDGIVVGKRVLKNKLLEMNGLTLKYFDITEDNMFNNHISLSASRKVSRIHIAEQIFKLIEEALGCEYPKAQIKKQNVFILKQDIQNLKENSE